MKKAAFHTLGCKVNAYETEAMRQLLEEAGYRIVPFEDAADVYIVNTCTVTNIADQKSRQMLHRARKRNPDALIVAAGCYAQIDQKGVQNDPAVDLVIGNNQKHRIVELLAQAENGAAEEQTFLEDVNAGRLPYEKLRMRRSGVHTRAFIKVQDGCDQFCSYCAIPYARGRVRSRSIEDTVGEIRALAQDGCREFVLTGIHLSSYGRQDAYNSDPTQGEPLLALIRAVHEVPGVERIRLGSLEPRIVTGGFADALAALPKVCPHFHLSLQSGCDATLQRMNRRYTTEEYLRACEKLRGSFSVPAITTDIIAGFPGETDDEFRQTLAFAEKVGFYEMHVFKYSRRRGTKADEMPAQVDEKCKNARSAKLLELSRKMSREFCRTWQGRRAEALLEEEIELPEGRYLAGYTKEYIRVALPADGGGVNRIVSGVLCGPLADGLYEIRPVC